jgi:hypothetical protein
LPELHILREEDMSLFTAHARALSDLEFARSQPIRLACLLLTKRAEAMASRGDRAGLIAAVDSVCGLEPTDKVSLLKLAYTCAWCLQSVQGFRASGLTDQERRTIQERCADRGIAALALAIELGLDCDNLLDERSVSLQRWNYRAAQLSPLRYYPGFPQLAEKWKANRLGR